ncbi:unnamed protein product [Discula destructiva]
MLAHNTTLRRPQTLFSVALITICLALIFSYERIKSSAFSLFQERIGPDNSFHTVADDEEAPYQSIFDSIGPMSYGTAHRPPMKGLPKNLIADLPHELVPALSTSGTDHVKRLIIIGDVHGHKSALRDLLDTLEFDATNDSLVFTGDLVNKGPDSAGVVELAMKLGAHSVRGNHEDRILLTRAAMDTQFFTDEIRSTTAAADESRAQDDGQDGQDDAKSSAAAHKQYQEHESKLSRGDERAREVARSLSPEQITWLSELPVILRVGPVPRGADHPVFENLLVVHAGLVPNVALENQDPWAVMNMRTVSYPVDQLRREAVRKLLIEKAKKHTGGNRGKLAALQAIDDSRVDEELQKILQLRGSDSANADVALPSSGRDGTYWYEEWSRVQEKIAKKEQKKSKKENKTDGKNKERHADPITTVVYGHDAKSALRVPQEYGKGKKGYTFGLDSGCVYGKQLTALVVEVKDDQAVHKIVQVDCAQHVEPDE